jgi:hypothetical protein
MEGNRMKEIQVKIGKANEKIDKKDDEGKVKKKKINIHLDVIETRGVGFDGCGNHTHQ